MTLEDFACDSSPVDQNDEVSTSELDITELSLPESFDDTLFLDLYKDLASESQTKNNCTSSNIQNLQSTTTKTLSLRSKNDDSYHEETEMKLRQLLATNLVLKEKARQYDSLKKLYSKRETEIESMSMKLRAQASLSESYDLREKQLQRQILELKKKNNLAEVDLDHAQKEVELLVNRSEIAEKEREDAMTALKDLQQQHDSLISCHASEQQDLKTRNASEIARIRQDTNQEIVSLGSRLKESYSREVKVLCDARDYAMEQVKLLQKELSEVRRDRQSKDVETSEITTELERQLADVRSDLKVKSCELNTIQACHDELAEEVMHYKKEHEKIKQELSKNQIDYVKLEKQSAIDLSKLEEIIRQKDEALKVYEHDDLLIPDRHDRPHEAGSSIISERKSLIKNSVALAKKCRELQALLQKSNEELYEEKVKNETLVKQAENTKRLYHELTSQSNNNAAVYILSAVKERDKEISRLNIKIHALYNELTALGKDRDDLASKLGEVLERRVRLDDMKMLVEEGMKQMKMIPAVTDTNAAFKCGNGPKEENIEESEDLLDHIVYHKKCTRYN
ncbi:hypothetical protein ACHAW6_009431 [Cyclotella cf. meneghiniana]